MKTTRFIKSLNKNKKEQLTRSDVNGIKKSVNSVINHNRQKIKDNKWLQQSFRMDVSKPNALAMSNILGASSINRSLQESLNQESKKQQKIKKSGQRFADSILYDLLFGSKNKIHNPITNSISKSLNEAQTNEKIKRQFTKNATNEQENEENIRQFNDATQRVENKQDFIHQDSCLCDKNSIESQKEQKKENLLDRILHNEMERIDKYIKMNEDKGFYGEDGFCGRKKRVKKMSKKSTYQKAASLFVGGIQKKSGLDATKDFSSNVISNNVKFAFNKIGDELQEQKKLDDKINAQSLSSIAKEFKIASSIEEKDTIDTKMDEDAINPIEQINQYISRNNNELKNQDSTIFITDLKDVKQDTHKNNFVESNNNENVCFNVDLDKQTNNKENKKYKSGSAEYMIEKIEERLNKKQQVLSRSRKSKANQSFKYADQQVKQSLRDMNKRLNKYNQEKDDIRQITHLYYNDNEDLYYKNQNQMNAKKRLQKPYVDHQKEAAKKRRQLINDYAKLYGRAPIVNGQKFTKW